jgi:hypothetical protein
VPVPCLPVCTITLPPIIVAVTPWSELAENARCAPWPHNTQPWLVEACDDAHALLLKRLAPTPGYRPRSASRPRRRNVRQRRLPGWADPRAGEGGR